MSSSAVASKLRSGLRHHQAGDATAAHKDYADVLKLQPTNADALHLSGLLAHASGNNHEARSLISQAIQIAPTEAKFQVNLAAILVAQSCSLDAEQVCQNILKSDPNNVGALTHLGTALRQQNRRGEALSVFELALEVQSDATTLTNLASILIDLGRFDTACELLEKAKAQSTNLPQVHINLSVIEHERGDDPAALRSLQIAESIAPNSAEVHINRGNVRLKSGDAELATECFQKAIALDSSNPRAASGLARALERIGFWEESLEAHCLAAQLNPADSSLYSNYLYSCCLSPLMSYREVHDAHVQWGQRIESESPELSHTNDRKINRPLRIGYVSPDFRGHATMKFLLPLLQAHTKSRFQLHFYSQAAKQDATTDAVRELSDSWCQTRELSDDQFTNKIQQDCIDILVDLAGHTADNRLAVFARKPAPVQVSFLGYPFTTGLSRIDYYLTDNIRDPQSADSLFVEELVRLPHGGCCFQPGDNLEVGPLPLLSNGFITLGSTHRLEKITDATLKVWGQILTQLPKAKLFMFRDVLRSESLRDQTLQRLMAAGINPLQVTFGWELPDPHLRVYNNIDILLDVFPWGSGTTGFDAMWMGVPIPTIAGDRSSSRGAASLVHHSGFPELTALSSDEYVSVVCKLAIDSDRLQHLRTNLRSAMETTVCNAAQFATDVENAYQRMWRRYVSA